MSQSSRAPLYFAIMAAALLAVGFLQSWPLAFNILTLCLISAIMALGVNIQWGYAGLFNVGIMGFAGLGGLASVLMSTKPVQGAWAAGGGSMVLAGLVFLVLIALVVLAVVYLPKRWFRTVLIFLIIVGGYFILRSYYDVGTEAIEGYGTVSEGFLGGLGLPKYVEEFSASILPPSLVWILPAFPVMLGWLIGGILAAGAAYVIGRISLGLRSDYLAIATLGISEILIATLKYEEWLTRGVSNVLELSRAAPRPVDLQKQPWFLNFAESIGFSVKELSTIWAYLIYCLIFFAFLAVIYWLSERALNAPWGRMMRAIRDNEVAAGAMGKNVKRQHLQVFVLGSAVIGLAGAMLTTLDGQFTPTSYQPLRFTFLIWVMTIVGGSGNNLGSILGGFLVWFLWIQAEPLGIQFLEFVTRILADDHPLREHLIGSAAHMRPLMMGLVLIIVLKFAPKGLLPERNR